MHSWHLAVLAVLAKELAKNIQIQSHPVSSAKKDTASTLLAQNKPIPNHKLPKF